MGVHAAFQPFVERFVHARLIVRYFIQQNDVIISAVASTHDSGLGMDGVMGSGGETVLLPGFVLVAHELRR